MPPVAKTSPNVKPKPTGGPKSAWDMLDSLKMLVYGRSGTGKTTFWSTFPGPILTLVCSGGNRPGELKSIDTEEMREKVTPTIIDSTDQIRDAIASFDGEGTLVLDHASGLADLALKEILGIKELPAQKGWGLATQQQYGQCTLQCKEIMRSILGKSCNVVIVAQERTFGDAESGGSDTGIQPTVGPALSPSLAGWLAPACDYVVRTEIRPRSEKVEQNLLGKKTTTWKIVPGEYEYVMRVGPHHTFQTKFRKPRGVAMPEVIVDPDYNKVLALVKGE